MTNNDCNYLDMEWREQLGRRVKAERMQQRYSVKSAAEAALVARDTWTKIEKGQPVHDANLAAALDLLGLDENGEARKASPAVALTEAAGTRRIQLSDLRGALTGAIDLGALAGAIDKNLKLAGEQLIVDATDLYHAARRIIESQMGGDGDADSTEPGGSAAMSEPVSAADDELSAAKTGEVEEAGEFNG